MTNIGKAYGFFDCRASKEEIEAELPVIKKFKELHGLEFTLVENPYIQLRNFARKTTEGEDFRNQLQITKDLIEHAEEYHDESGLRLLASRLARLEQVVNIAHGESGRYALIARKEGTNEAAAKDLSVAMYQLYQTYFYEPGEEYVGTIVYKDKDQYKVME